MRGSTAQYVRRDRLEDVALAAEAMLQALAEILPGIALFVVFCLVWGAAIDLALR